MPSAPSRSGRLERRWARSWCGLGRGRGMRPDRPPDASVARSAVPCAISAPGAKPSSPRAGRASRAWGCGGAATGMIAPMGRAGSPKRPGRPSAGRGSCRFCRRSRASGCSRSAPATATTRSRWRVRSSREERWSCSTSARRCSIRPWSELPRRASRTCRATLGDARRLPYPDCGFDAAYLVVCLGEMPDRDAAVREVARVLRPGGAARRW